MGEQLFTGNIFQSTLPVGGATGERRTCQAPFWNFNPRSPWGERRGRESVAEWISAFQSTLPVGGATV